MSLKLRNFYEIGREVNIDPLVYVFEDFLHAQEIELLMELAKPYQDPELVPVRKIAADSQPKFKRVI